MPVESIRDLTPVDLEKFVQAEEDRFRQYDDHALNIALKLEECDGVVVTLTEETEKTVERYRSNVRARIALLLNSNDIYTHVATNSDRGLEFKVLFSRIPLKITQRTRREAND